MSTVNAAILDDLYRTYNRRELVHPDPLEFLYEYDDGADREIVALIASSLAFGRVAQILKSVRKVLERMPSPAVFLAGATRDSLIETFGGFKHRFVTGDDLAAMLSGAKSVIEEYGSLHACFAAGLSATDATVLPALSAFADRLLAASGGAPNYLIPRPSGGAACKRLHLFLRWMVRRDDVDPGGWDDVPASKLIVPLDTHMQRICRELQLTARNQADARTALEVTEAFREFAPDDPVKYDFALTRLGIRRDADLDEFLRAHGVQEATAHG